jgi:hypothetical protein
MTRRRKVAIGCGASTLIVLAGLAGTFAYVTRDDPRYAHVVSIEREPVYQEAEHLERAWALPVARTFHDDFAYQPNGSYCGPTRVAATIRSLGGEATPDDTILAGTDIDTVLGILPGGITLDQLAELTRARLPSARITVHRDLDLASFRALLSRANDPAARMIANFHRGPLFGRGGGHHSPIGGYLEAEDLVFVLDVNERYRPWLTTSERLFTALDTIDPMSGQKRGILLIEQPSS